MSRRVLFNGVVLVRPGAATKIDASQFEDVALSGLGVVGLIGSAAGGVPRTVQVFASAAAVKNHYKSGDLVEAAAIVADPGKDDRIPAGAQVIVCYKTNNSTRATLAQAAMTFASQKYGLAANNARVTWSGTVLTVSDLDDFGVVVTETSPTLGGTGKFSIQYTGPAATATVTVSATQILCATAGAVEDITVNFADFNNLAEIIRYIDGFPNWSCTSLITNDSSFDPSYLDAITTQNAKSPATLTVFAKNFDVYDWVTKNSSLITVSVFNKGIAAMGSFTETALAGGTVGTADNTAFTNAYVAMGGLRINQLVPLVSADGSGGNTFTVASVIAGLASHCKYYSGTAGRSERQGFAGVAMTKTNLQAQAVALNSEHVCLFGQKAQRFRALDGALTTLSEWATACIAAGMRAGAPLGEPLTWKYVNAVGFTNDPSWDANDDGTIKEMLLNGIMVITEVKGRGFRIEKGITTYLRSENDAFIEESIVQIWKAYAYDLRQALEDRYVGRPGNVNTVKTVPHVVVTVSERYKEAGAITDNVLSDGSTENAYRGVNVALSGDQMTVGVTITPTPGINFVLNTIALTPARISA